MLICVSLLISSIHECQLQVRSLSLSISLSLVLHIQSRLLSRKELYLWKLYILLFVAMICIIVVVICISESVNPCYLKKDSLPFTTLWSNLELGFLITTARMHGIDWQVLHPCVQYIKSHISNIVIVNPKWV